MAINLGTAAPSAYYIGTNAVSAIYLGSTSVLSVSSAKLTLSATGGASWNSGGDGLSSATAYTKNSWAGSSGSSTGDETLKATAISAGVIRVTWTGSSATSGEPYGEIDIWKNVAFGSGAAAVNLQDGSSGSGSYNATVTAGQYVLLHLYGAGTWSGIKVWWTAT